MEEFKGLSNSDYNMLTVLIKSDADYNEFIEYAQKARNLKFALVGYREKKLQRQDYPVEKFVSDYEENSIKALQQLFLHPVIKCDVDMVDKAIQNGKLTLVGLHARHMAQPTLQLLRVAFAS
jgi:2,4-dienoyl-CoA reductase-like NADH-dependent reductase (Old Yellow Enzyme family)